MNRHKNRIQIDQERRVCAQNYAPLPVVLDRGEGVWVWDVEGRRYLDMLAGYSALNHGHCHPRLIQVLLSQAQTLTMTSRAFHNNRLAQFLDKICFISGFERALPMNTGAEAVETAIKAARKWGYIHKNIPAGQAEIIVAHQNFHGRTTTIVSFSSDSSSQEGFSPLTPGFVSVPFGDAAALEAAISPRTCAVLLEPIQGEGGVILPPVGYLKNVEQVCSRENVLFILDEIQAGLGRAGYLFAFQKEDVHPDALTLGKSLGGGMLPVSVFLARKEVMDVFTPGTHGSTFGGNPLGAAVALEALQILEDEAFVSRSHTLGTVFLDALRQIEHPALAEVRGQGLWVGLDVNPTYITGKELCLRLLEKGLLTKETRENTVRFSPPLVIQGEELKEAISIIRSVFREV